VLFPVAALPPVPSHHIVSSSEHAVSFALSCWLGTSHMSPTTAVCHLFIVALACHGVHADNRDLMLT
jgi:hypothetical protein